jgi:F-type H+-transporting ATPase subunit b
MAENTHSESVAHDPVASEHDLQTSTGAHGGAESQFPPFNTETFTAQLVWLVLIFTLLYLLMSRVVLPRIGEVIDERRERIQRDLDSAERLKSETDKALGDYEKALSDARGNAGVIARETRDKLDEKAAQRQAEVDQQINTRIAEAEQRIDATRTKALASVEEIATEVAGAVVKRLIDTDVPADEIRSILKTRSS